VTASTLAFNGRLPGVDCQPALPAGPPAIRLDIAGFVGFAERGPLDVPVAVEDATQYSTIFGADVVLATDGGVPVYANLPGAVQAFFDNGGQRCYVVRVAGPDAAAAIWLVPGMRLYYPDGVAEDVYLQAAWPGSWSDGYGVGTQLLTEPLSVLAPYVRAHGPQQGTLRLSANSLLLLQAGDLLRLDLGPHLPGLYVTVSQVDMANSIVRTGAEIPFLAGLVSPPEPDEQLLVPPDALAGLPATLPVRGAWRLQLDLIVRQVTAGAAQVAERWTSLGFNQGAGRSWLDVIQLADVGVPDQTRSLLLRADARTLQAAANGLFVPLGMDQLGSAAEFADPAAGPSGESAVQPGNDGLSRFDPVGMFLDQRLRNETVYSLLSDADQLTVLAASPVQLQGIHAFIGVDDVALVSVPDAVHVGWSPAPPPPPALKPASPAPPQPPDWSRFRDCAVTQPAAPAAVPSAAVSSPVLSYPVLDDPAGYDPAGLLEVHTALIQLCAGRSDVFAVLGVPRHYDAAAALRWLQQLSSNAQPAEAGRIVMSPLSFAGFWHPWVRVVERTSPALAPLRDQPADGAACGMIAARELARGVWVAPADVPLRGPVALTQALSAGDTVRLFDAHANLLRSQPGSISALSAHTLAADPNLMQVSVRRLIILLRKIALQEGSRYVFDTNTDRFRQLVRLRFERILAALTSFGALSAYQVVTDGGVNTAADAANGQLVVTLQVAPTSPVEFITVSLIRAGESLLDVVVG
jgi:hypothetical protein